MKILVVGGAGYIGGTVTDNLLRKKIPFTVYDNLTYENDYLKPVDFIYGDIRDHKKLEKILPNYSHIVWLAALVGDGACAIRPTLTKEINQNTVEWLSRKYQGRIIFTSTCSVYGLNKNVVNEKSPTNPLSVYAKTKLAAENFLLKKNALIFRLGTAYGLSDEFSRLRMDLAINYMTMNAVTKKKLVVYDGKQWRPFIHVKEIGKIIVKNIINNKKGVYNLATQNLTILKAAQIIKKITGCKIQTTLTKTMDSRNYHADTTKGLKDKIFDSTTDYPLVFGIEEIKQLVLSNRIKNLASEYYYNEKYLLQQIMQYDTYF